MNRKKPKKKKKDKSRKKIAGDAAEQPEVIPQCRMPRIDDLKEEQLEIFAQNCWLVSLIENKVPVKEALRRLGINRSERSVRHLMHRYKKDGRKGLFDRRWLKEAQAKVLTPIVKKIALAMFFAWPAAGARALWKELCKECQKRNITEPGESVVSKFFASLPEPYRLFREGKLGIRKWEQQGAPVVRYENTTFANERWQGDHSPIPIWVRAKEDGIWKPFRAYLSALLDAHTRSIAGFIVSIKYPDSWVIALLFHRAIMPKRRKTWKNQGFPFVFQSDRGKDFVSRAVAATLGRLGTLPDPDPPCYPNRKGKVERFFQTLDSGCLRLLPGHMDAIGRSDGAAAKRVNELLTLPQLCQEIERWIDEDYHRRTHSETGRKPAELWEETVRLRLPESEDDLNLLLLKDDVARTVKNIGIDFTLNGARHTYMSPVLLDHYKSKVRIAYNPEDLESVLVYDSGTGKFICEAFDMRSDNPHFNVDDVKKWRSQYRRGMKERIKEYFEEVYLEDRRCTRADEWDEARQQAAKAQEEELLRDATSEDEAEDDEDVILLLEEFRRRDRGETNGEE
ncbi:MAG TPA: Mu transposase C-terminal domain-containing protein [Pyrinomonadaceae bacterium]|jgi:putative transposase